ncbi:hypothetical protein [Streptomyces sp. NPDC002763]|uniref:hypothetical protein n=1 Tax=Streptomyces sp. NPDC002763 TaxID=3154427 RepID=UPI003326B709
MAPLVDEGHQMIADASTADQIAVITDFLQRATELQQRHVRQLRARPASAVARGPAARSPASRDVPRATPPEPT